MLQRGVAPDAAITMRHEGSSIVSMRSIVRQAARLRVEESDKGGLRTRRYVASHVSALNSPSHSASPAKDGNPAPSGSIRTFWADASEITYPVPG